ncbi:MAG: type II toxin-antitoxin system HicA family toxin [Clostridium sp.]|nr:type II toxin-antitoxin system HicA family toxin [Clostridium sp.]
MTVREILKVFHKDGWYITNQESSHISLKHPVKPGKGSYRKECNLCRI